MLQKVEGRKSGICYLFIPREQNGCVSRMPVDLSATCGAENIPRNTVGSGQHLRSKCKKSYMHAPEEDVEDDLRKGELLPEKLPICEVARHCDRAVSIFPWERGREMSDGQEPDGNSRKPASGFCSLFVGGVQLGRSSPNDITARDRTGLANATVQGGRCSRRRVAFFGPFPSQWPQTELLNSRNSWRCSSPSKAPRVCQNWKKLPKNINEIRCR